MKNNRSSFNSYFITTAPQMHVLAPNPKRNMISINLNNWCKKCHSRRKLFTLLAIALLFSFNGMAQLPCLGVTNQCAGFDPAVWASFKCITGPVKFSDLINNNPQLLLPQAAAVTTLQRLVVKGVIIDDISTASGGYTFAPGSEIIFADETSGIEVEVQCKLVLDNSTLRGCFSMWKSVYVKHDATFIAKNECNFYYGIEAVKVQQSSIISITDCNFENNLYAIVLGDVLTNNQRMPIYFAPNGGIWGNNIIGGVLNTPYTNFRSYEGICVRSVSNIQIGNAGHNMNEISNIKNSFFDIMDLPCAGIYNGNSDVTIVNTRFWDIGISTLPQPTQFRPQDAAISVANKGKITFTGLGLASDIIEGGNVGVYFNYSTGDISNAKFHDNEHGIIYESAEAKLVGNLKMDNCKFEGFNSTGVWIRSGFNIIPLTVFEVKNCIFDDTRNIPGSRNYLKIEPGIQTKSANFNISDNKFYYRDRPLSGSGAFYSTCIYLKSLNEGTATGNEFYNLTQEVHYRSFIGGEMDGCIGFHWNNNIFLGSGLFNDLTQNEFGLAIENSPLCKYSCNQFNNLKYGMKIALNCDASILNNNNFTGNTAYGIYLEQVIPPILTVIGRQDRRGNTWTSSGANMEYNNYNPFGGQDKFNVQRSLFSIQNTNENSTLWANPRIVGGIDDAPFHNWFKYKPLQLGGPLPFDPCITQIDPHHRDAIDYWDMAVVNGTFMPWKGYEADTWEAAFYLYKRMSEDQILLPAGSMEANWYSNTYNGNIGKLWRVYSGYLSLSDESPSSTVTQLSSDLNAITVTTTHEQNLKTCLRIFIAQHLSDGTPLTFQQLTDLTNIADQCRAEGGLGVVFARLALGQPSRKAEDCPEDRGENITRPDQTSYNTLNTTIFPNPTSDEFSVRMNQPILNGEARLLSNKGQLVGTWKIAGTQFTIQSASINPGVYLLEVSEQGLVLSRNKIVFIR